VGDERLSQSELPRAADSPKPVRIMLPQTGVSQREGTLEVGYTDEHDNKSRFRQFFAPEPRGLPRLASSVPFSGRTNRRGRKSNAILQQFRRDYQKARDQPCPQAKNVLLLRPLDLCVLPSGAGLVDSCRGHVERNRRDLFLASRLGEHALARITSVVVSWTWVWLLRCSHGVEGQKKPCDRKRQRCPFAELVVAGSLLNLDFVSKLLLQLSTRQPKSVSPAQTPIFSLFINGGLR
jgi:hypothetical protein